MARRYAPKLKSVVAREREIDRLVGRANRSGLMHILKRIIAGLERDDHR